MTLPKNLLAEAEAEAPAYPSLHDCWMNGVHWLFQRLCELSEAGFDSKAVSERVLDALANRGTSDQFMLLEFARREHALMQAALLRQREKLAKTREALIAEENAFQTGRARAERLEKALREIAENVDDISSYETARQALSGE